MPIYNRWIHDFINVEPARAARLHFRWYSLITAAVGGWFFAYMTVDHAMLEGNSWYNRPDFKPYPAMVKQVHDDTEQSMLRNQYKKHMNLGDEKKGILYRYFFTKDADFELKYNPYRNSHPDDVFNPKKPVYPTYSNDFRDHERD